MFMYFGEVVIKNNKDAEWVVEEYVFLPGKYELIAPATKFLYMRRCRQTHAHNVSSTSYGLS